MKAFLFNAEVSPGSGWLTPGTHEVDRTANVCWVNCAAAPP
jgi:hypothetical protein